MNEPTDAERDAVTALCAINLSLQRSGFDPTLHERTALYLCGVQAQVILAAIKANQIPGLALKTYDGTTCWACEKCGKIRTGRGCMRCLEDQVAALRAEEVTKAVQFIASLPTPEREEETIERMAAASWDLHATRKWAEIPEAWKPFYRDQMRAAVGAMVKP